jgi:hypothetical protein
MSTLLALSAGRRARLQVRAAGGYWVRIPRDEPPWVGVLVGYVERTGSRWSVTSSTTLRAGPPWPRTFGTRIDAVDALVRAVTT